MISKCVKLFKFQIQVSRLSSLVSQYASLWETKISPISCSVCSWVYVNDFPVSVFQTFLTNLTPQRRKRQRKCPVHPRPIPLHLLSTLPEMCLRPTPCHLHVLTRVSVCFRSRWSGIGKRWVQEARQEDSTFWWWGSRYLIMILYLNLLLELVEIFYFLFYFFLFVYNCTKCIN
jgi:hypothetical protein